MQCDPVVIRDSTFAPRQTPRDEHQGAQYMSNVRFYPVSLLRHNPQPRKRVNMSENERPIPLQPNQTPSSRSPLKLKHSPGYKPPHNPPRRAWDHNHPADRPRRYPSCSRTESWQSPRKTRARRTRSGACRGRRRRSRQGGRSCCRRGQPASRRGRRMPWWRGGGRRRPGISFLVVLGCSWCMLAVWEMGSG